MQGHDCWKCVSQIATSRTQSRTAGGRGRASPGRRPRIRRLTCALATPGGQCVVGGADRLSPSEATQEGSARGGEVRHEAVGPEHRARCSSPRGRVRGSRAAAPGVRAPRRRLDGDSATPATPPLADRAGMQWRHDPAALRPGRRGWRSSSIDPRRERPGVHPQRRAVTHRPRALRPLFSHGHVSAGDLPGREGARAARLGATGRPR